MSSTRTPKTNKESRDKCNAQSIIKLTQGNQSQQWSIWLESKPTIPKRNEKPKKEERKIKNYGNTFLNKTTVK